MYLRFTVYMLECANGAFFTGMTTNLSRTLFEIESSTSRRSFVYRRKAQKLVYQKTFSKFEDANEHEDVLRRMSNKQKREITGLELPSLRLVAG